MKTKRPMNHRYSKVMSKPRRLGILGTSMEDTCLLSIRHSVYRRHELITGFGTEHGNLLIDVKGKDKCLKTRE